MVDYNYKGLSTTFCTIVEWAYLGQLQIVVGEGVEGEPLGVELTLQSSIRPQLHIQTALTYNNMPVVDIHMHIMYTVGIIGMGDIIDIKSPQ